MAGAASAALAGQADEKSNANRNCKRDQRAMLDLARQAAQCLISELGGVAADFRHFVAHGIGASAQVLGDAAQCRSDALAHMIHRLRRACSRAAAGCF